MPSSAAAARRATAARSARKHTGKRAATTKLCRKIRKGGGAEQYHADTKYTEAVGVAAEACAEDTKGQTCYICTQALHWKTKEGLVRGCACRGTAGFAHVSCLAEQAKILVAEALRRTNWAIRQMRGGGGGSSAACASKLPRGRDVRTRVGVLEDVRGAAGDGHGSDHGDDGRLGTVYTEQNTTRTRCP